MDRLDTVDLTACERDMYVMGDDRARTVNLPFKFSVLSVAMITGTVGSVRHTKAANRPESDACLRSTSGRSHGWTNSVAKQCERATNN